MNRNIWNKRIRRAEELLERRPASSQLLAFYRCLLALQQEVRQALESHFSSARSPASVPLREQLDVEFAMRWLPSLMTMVQKQGPAKLAEESMRLDAAGVAHQQKILSAFLQEEQPAGDVSSSFFARALFQPYAEFLAVQRTPPAVYSGSLCPICGDRPQLAVLRPEGDGGKRHLACSLCLTEWEFRRIICPVCEGTDPAKLPRYSPEDPIAVRVEACDTCKNYLKSFDMTVDGLIVPEVDEIATVALDLWAAGHGYRKFHLNLLGF